MRDPLSHSRSWSCSHVANREVCSVWQMWKILRGLEPMTFVPPFPNSPGAGDITRQQMYSLQERETA